MYDSIRLDIPGSRKPAPNRHWAPPAAGLATALCLTWVACPTRLGVSISWFELWVLATRCTIPIFLATAAAAWISLRVLRRRPSKADYELLLDTACAGTWFPPILIFSAHGSPWAALAATALAITITRAILAGRKLGAGAEFEWIEPGAGGFFLHTPPRPEPRRIVESLAIALCAQALAITGAIDRWRLAALIAAVGACLATHAVTATIWPAPQPGRGRVGRVRILPALFLAVTFSAGGFTPYLRRGGGEGNGSGGNGGADYAERFSASGDKASRPDAKQGEPGGSGAVVMGESWPGVILWPEVERRTILVPPMPSLGHGLFSRRLPNPLSVPFYGAYWFFKGSGEPPKTSLVAHGDAARMSFRSTDLQPLTMEARQNLGNLIDTRCCSGIEVAIRNGDRRPGTLAIELILRNTTLPDQPSESLGSRPVESTLAWYPGDERSPVSDKLTFPMPASPRLRQFDEVTVLFHLLPPRRDRSAKIAIDRFVFVPRY